MLHAYSEYISDSYAMNFLYLDKIQELDMHDYLAINVISYYYTQLSIEFDQLNDFVWCDQKLMAFGEQCRTQVLYALEFLPIMQLELALSVFDLPVFSSIGKFVRTSSIA